MLWKVIAYPKVLGTILSSVWASKCGSASWIQQLCWKIKGLISVLHKRWRCCRKEKWAAKICVRNLTGHPHVPSMYPWSSPDPRLSYVSLEVITGSKMSRISFGSHIQSTLFYSPTALLLTVLFFFPLPGYVLEDRSWNLTSKFRLLFSCYLQRAWRAAHSIAVMPWERQEGVGQP